MVRRHGRLPVPFVEWAPKNGGFNVFLSIFKNMTICVALKPLSYDYNLTFDKPMDALSN